MIGSGMTLGAAGCLSLEAAGPVNFELLNFTEDRHQIEITISEREGDIVLDDTYEISDRSRGPAVIREAGITEARNGDWFTISIARQGTDPEEGGYRVTCNKTESTENLFLAEIREYEDRDYVYFEFDQSTYSGGL